MRLLETVPAGDELGEAILWNPQDGKFWWTDIHGSRLRRHRPGVGAVETLTMPDRVGSFAFLQDEPEDARVLMAFATGLGVHTLGTGETEWLFRPDDHRGRRFNDGRVDRAGRFWTATMVEHAHLAGADSATLWLLDWSGAARPQFGGIAIGNTLAVNHDGTRLYFSDSPRRVIFALALDPETGAIRGKRVFAEIAQGVPDGATVDEEDCLWVAIWGAACILRFDPAGREIARFALPASQPTCLAFGGENLDLLAITSAREGLAPAQAEAENAGDVFLVDAGVAGVTDMRYRMSTRAKAAQPR